MKNLMLNTTQKSCSLNILLSICLCSRDTNVGVFLHLATRKLIHRYTLLSTGEGKHYVVKSGFYFLAFSKTKC